MLAFPYSPHSAALAPDAVNRRLVECRRDFLSYFRRRLGRPEDAEDAFQDFCLKVIRARKTPDDGDMIDAWLGRILRNTLIDHYRRCASRQRGEATYERELQVTAHGVEAGQGGRACPCIHDALPTLKPEYAEVLRRAFFDEEPRARIADELGLSPNNLGVRLHRARRALRRKLEESCASCCDGGFLNCDCGSVGGTRERVATSSVECDVAAQ
jgi:RNA polymerase sigma factor (sigma-70 family)